MDKETLIPVKLAWESHNTTQHMLYESDSCVYNELLGKEISTWKVFVYLILNKSRKTAILIFKYGINMYFQSKNLCYHQDLGYINIFDQELLLLIRT